MNLSVIDIYFKKKIMEKSNSNNCSFCLRPAGQIRTILRTIFTQLKNMLQDKRYSDLGPSTQQNSGAIGRLVRIAFDQHQFQLKISKGCSHLKLRSLLKQKLRCRNDQLEIMLQDLCDKIARRNYELQIISSQIKNVENSINQIDDPCTPHSQKKSTQEENFFREDEKDQVKEEMTPKVKVEEDVSHANHVPEGSPQTVIPYVSTSFGDMPYSYNFLFYGPYYQ